MSVTRLIRYTNKILKYLNPLKKISTETRLQSQNFIQLTRTAFSGDTPTTNYVVATLNFNSLDAAVAESRADFFDEIEIDLNLGFDSSCAPTALFLLFLSTREYIENSSRINPICMYIIIWLRGILRCSTNINLIELKSSWQFLHRSNQRKYFDASNRKLVSRT